MKEKSYFYIKLRFANGTRRHLNNSNNAKRREMVMPIFDKRTLIVDRNRKRQSVTNFDTLRRQFIARLAHINFHRATGHRSGRHHGRGPDHAV